MLPDKPTVKLFSDTHYGRTYVYLRTSSLAWAQHNYVYVFIRSEAGARQREAKALSRARTVEFKKNFVRNSVMFKAK